MLYHFKQLGWVKHHQASSFLGYWSAMLLLMMPMFWPSSSDIETSHHNMPMKCCQNKFVLLFPLKGSWHSCSTHISLSEWQLPSSRNSNMNKKDSPIRIKGMSCCHFLSTEIWFPFRMGIIYVVILVWYPQGISASQIIALPWLGCEGEACGADRATRSLCRGGILSIGSFCWNISIGQLEGMM